MKGFVLILLALAGFSGVLRCEDPAAPSLDEVLARHAQARGGLEKLQAMKGCKMTGTITLAEEGLALPLAVWRKRPDRLRVETVLAGATAVQACNDRQAWWIVPAYGLAAREMPPDRERAFRRQADFADPLLAPKERGWSLELVPGTPGQDGRFQLLKRSASGGREVLYWIDAASGLLHKCASAIGTGEAARRVELVYGDYRPVSGLPLPFLIETLASGKVQAKIVFDAIEIDPELPESLFSMPAGAEAPARARKAGKGKKTKK